MLIEDDNLEINFHDQEDFFSLMKNCPVAPFDVYWVKLSGAKTKIISSGSVLCQSEVERWTAKPLKLEFIPVVREEFLKSGFEIFKQFKNLDVEQLSLAQERFKWRKDFLNWLKLNFWEEGQTVSQLELITLIGKDFYELDEELKKVFFSFPLEIQKRNLLRASISILMALALGYQDFQFLREYYTVLLYMDYPFSEKMWSERDKDALNLFLEAKEENSKVHLEKLYKTKIERGITLLKTKIENKGLANYLQWSFESLLGKGLLLNINGREMNDLDAVTALSHRILPFQDSNLEGEVKIRGVLNYFDEGEQELHRMSYVISKVFQELEEQDNGYLEIVGL